ncbi:hypothetical protein [Nocardioides massiliensis]|uniref:DUF559 domain-containing protein n=1 Tax=Nocardioides massiliensis TaxID=1325935 RepID=A0ABT9NNH9_9ACTN|nr:hypothetical protein [Nocardioides massiliensis]MDP9821610.1 hypothetical protein [Nocardioides massiliensis]
MDERRDAEANFATLSGMNDVRCRPPRLVAPVRVGSGPPAPSRGEARGKRWRRAGPGLYVPSSVEPTVEQRIVEEWARLPEAVVTGWAAARLHGAAYLDGLDSGAPRPVPLLLAPGSSAPRAWPGARIVRQPLPAQHRAEIQGIPVTTPARAVGDIARLTRDHYTAVVDVEMAYAAGIAHPTWVATALDDAPVWGARRARQVLRVAGVRSCSPPESRLRLVCRAIGWDPLVNVEVFDPDGEFLARPDLLDVERGIAIEYDGSEHRTAARHRQDNARLHRLRSAGLEVVTIVGGGLLTPDDRVEAVRLLHDAERLAARPRERAWTLDAPPWARPWVPRVAQLRVDG